MSASCELSLIFHGSDIDFERIIDKIYEIENKSRTENFIFPLIQIDGHRISAHNGVCRNIWGSDYLHPDVDMYLEFAKLAPDSAFEVESYRVNEVGGGGAETYLKVSYKDRVLSFEVLSGVDDISFPFIVGEMYSSFCHIEPTVAISGSSKLFSSVAALADYLEEWDCTIAENITPEVEYLICNDSDSNADMVKKAKELGITIVSEMKFIRMFADVFDFEDQFVTLFSDITFEEFSERFVVDETITPEVLEEMKEFPEINGMILSMSGEVSLEGTWEKQTYFLGGDNKFREVEI